MGGASAGAERRVASSGPRRSPSPEVPERATLYVWGPSQLGRAPRPMTTDFSLASLVVGYVVFLFSTTFHEFSHAVVAYLGGDRTAYEGGQVSLDPVPHIRRSPFGLVVVPLISFVAFGWMIGWASAPFDPRWAGGHPRRYAAMSVAGPIANLLLAAVA